MKFDFEECIKSGVDQAMRDCELTIGMTLKEAVEKQIPKKPTVHYSEETYRGCINKKTRYKCVLCEQTLYIQNHVELTDGFKRFPQGTKSKHCPNCGQALDWEEI